MFTTSSAWISIVPDGAHAHGASGTDSFATVVLVAPFAGALLAYLTAVAIQRRRGAAWPRHRSAMWVAGIAVAASGFVGPLAEAAHRDFVAHMVTHVLVGMVAPVLLVLAKPVTLALRTMSVIPARRLTRLLRSPLGRVVGHPVTAAVLNVGGMWVLYLTPLHESAREVPLVHLAVMFHFLAAGTLFVTAIVAAEPSPHRAPLALRAGVLLAALAAHGVLAKVLYATPPAGVAAAEAQLGARVMFTSGDVVDLVLMVLLGLEWLRATNRREARLMRRADLVKEGIR